LTEQQKTLQSSFEEKQKEERFQLLLKCNTSMQKYIEKQPKKILLSPPPEVVSPPILSPVIPHKYSEELKKAENVKIEREAALNHLLQERVEKTKISGFRM